jgi:hypothetical protein
MGHTLAPVTKQRTHLWQDLQDYQDKKKSRKEDVGIPLLSRDLTDVTLAVESKEVDSKFLECGKITTLTNCILVF